MIAFEYCDFSLPNQSSIYHGDENIGEENGKEFYASQETSKNMPDLESEECSAQRTRTQNINARSNA